MDLPTVIGWVMAAFFGGSGLVGLLMMNLKEQLSTLLIRKRKTAGVSIQSMNAARRSSLYRKSSRYSVSVYSPV